MVYITFIWGKFRPGRLCVNSLTLFSGSELCHCFSQSVAERYVVIMGLLRVTFPTTSWAHVDLIHLIHTLTTAGRVLKVWYSKGLYTMISPGR